MQTKYISPEIKVLRIDSDTMLAGSGPVGTKLIDPSTGGAASNQYESLSKHHSVWEDATFEE